jgi:hypothetical protein
MNFYNNDPNKIFNQTGTTACKNFFQLNIIINIIVAAIIAVLAVLQIIKLFFISKNFFLKKHVPHTATCEDEDIIVY